MVKIKKLGFNVSIDDIFPWNTINSAPKDGTDILLFVSGFVFHAKWSDEFLDWVYPLPDQFGFSIGGRDNPTHWAYFKPPTT